MTSLRCRILVPLTTMVARPTPMMAIFITCIARSASCSSTSLQKKLKGVRMYKIHGGWCTGLKRPYLHVGRLQRHAAQTKLKAYSITYTVLFEKVLLLLSKIDYEAVNGNFSQPFNLIHGKNKSGVL